MNTDMKQEKEIEILNLDLTVVGDATGNVALYHKSVFDFLDHLAVVELKTDKDFLTATDLIKKLKAQEDLIDESEKKAKNGSVSVADAFRMLSEAKEAFRKARRALKTQVEAEKKVIRNNIIENAEEELFNYNLQLLSDLKLMSNLGENYSPQILEAMKGKSSVLKIQEAVDKVVAQAKGQISSKSNQMASNKALVQSQPNQHLFNDLPSLIAKPFVELQKTIKERNDGEVARLEILQKGEQKKAEAKAQKELEEKQEVERLEQERIEAEKVEKEKIIPKENPIVGDQLPPTSDNPVSAEIAPTEKEHEPFTKDDLEVLSEDQELPGWMSEPTAKENLTVEGVQEYQLTFKASNEDAKAIQSYIQKIYFGVNPILTLANQQG